MKKNSTSNRSKSGSTAVRTAHALPHNTERERAFALKDIDLKAVAIRFGLLLIPAVVAILAGRFLQNDLADFVTWWAMFYLYGWATFPLVAHFFRGFVSAGYGFSRSLGILLTTGPVWLISYLGIWESFNRPMTFVMFFLLAILCWGIPKTRDAALVALSDMENIFHIIGEEILFIAVFAFLCFCKGIFPIINGEEKFMNFGFMNSMLRYDGLPAKDPWLSGHSINYYYYGQYIFSYLTKMLGTQSSVAYNISMCAAIALPFASAFSLGQMFIDALRQKRDCQVSKWYLPFAGLLSSACVILFGNSHSFFYDEQSFGNRMLYWDIWQKIGVNVGERGNFFYPNSTRFIGHNPNLKELGLSTKGDLTIHEFPFYSYLIGDLHAHVVSMTIVLLIIAFIFVAVYRAEFPKTQDTQMYHNKHYLYHLVEEMGYIFRPEFLMCAYLLGLTQMCNYWDFLIYFIFCSMGILIYQCRRSTYMLTFSSFLVFGFELGGILGVYLKFGSNVFAHLCLQIAVFVIAYLLTTCFPSAFSRTGLAMSLLFSIASIVSLSFNVHFEMISNFIALTDRHTSLFQFLIVWLVHLLIPLALVVLVVATRRYGIGKEKAPKLPAPLPLVRPVPLEENEEKPAVKEKSSASKEKTISESVAAPITKSAASSDPDLDDPDLSDPDLYDALSETETSSEKKSAKRAKAKASVEAVSSDAASSEDNDPDTPAESEEEDFEKQDPRLLVILGKFFPMLEYWFAKLGDNMLCKFFRKRSIIDIFMVGMTFVGFMLLFAPEVMYVRDIYGDDCQRSNTMFKFTFAGFIILSLVVAYTVFRFMAHMTKKGNLSYWGLTVSIVMLILIITIPGHYTLRALDQRTGDIKSENYQGLDGTAYLPNCVPVPDSFLATDKRVAGAMVPYEEAIDWLNENVEGSVNICEAYGLSYTERCIVSAYTGLPTVVGWQTHEWLWHFQGWINPETGVFESDPQKDVWNLYLLPRHEDVSRIYTSTSLVEVSTLLSEYDITYVICGSMELDEFGLIYYPVLETIGENVFTSSDGSLTIYKVQN